jgi:expansin (peptidoglycan-binding protein)
LSQAATSPLPALTEEEDSDSWLNIDAKDFDDMLEKTMGPKPLQGNTDVTDREVVEDQLANEQASKLQTLAGKVEEFIEGEGTLEGALFEEFVFLCAHAMVN